MQRGNFIEATKQNKKKKEKQNEIVKLRQSEQIKQQICMRYICGSCSRGTLRVALIANFILIHPMRVAIFLRKQQRGACCQFMCLRIEMKFHYMQHNYEKQVKRLTRRVLDYDIPAKLIFKQISRFIEACRRE